jgi:hypothetical protein
MHDAQQRKQDGVHHPDDGEHHPEDANCLLMGYLPDRTPQPIFEAIDRRFEIGFCSEVGQDMPGQRFGMRFGGAALDAGGFKFLCVSERVDRHPAAVVFCTFLFPRS